MKVTTERLEHCQVNVFIELDAAEVDEKMRQAARNLSRKVNVPGYRRGKAPYATVLRYLGREVIQEQVVDDFGQDLYDQGLKEIKYEPYEVGALKDVSWDPFRMTVLVPIQPEVELGDYRTVRVPFEVEPVADDQVEKSLLEVQQQHAQWVPVDQPAALGDQVVADVTGWVANKEIVKLEGEEMVLDAQAKEPLPGLHEQIVGLAPGAEKSFALTYPPDYADKELAGKEATFTAHVHAVKQKDLPALNDDLAMMVGDYDALDDLKAAVRKRLEVDAEEKAKPTYLDKVLDVMLGQVTRIDYPPQAVDREVTRAVERMERNLSSSGLKLDRYLHMIGKTRQAYEADFRPKAEELLKKRLVMVEIAKQEGIKVEAAEVEAEADRLSAMLREDAEELREALASPSGRLSIASDLVMERVQERIVEIGRGAAPPKHEVETAVAEGNPPGSAAQGQLAEPQAEAVPPDAEGSMPVEG